MGASLRAVGANGKARPVPKCISGGSRSGRVPAGSESPQLIMSQGPITLLGGFAMGTSLFISSLSRGLAVVLLLTWAPRAWAVDPAEWLIVQGINRGETSATWTSPTAVDLDEVAWQWDFEITRITGTVNLGVFGNVTEDMTSSFPEEFRVRSGVVGALPVVLIDDVVVEPASG